MTDERREAAIRAAAKAYEEQFEKWRGETFTIACCSEHGLHGARDTCFECGEPVEQVPVRVVEAVAAGAAEQELERLRKALTRIDNEVPSEEHWHRMGDSMWANIGRLAVKTARAALASPPDEGERG